MVGKRPTKGEQIVFALFFGFKQVVFELSVFVPRYQRVDGILSSDVEMNALFSQKGHINMLIGDNQIVNIGVPHLSV